jgi:hypothetical protein
LILKAGGSNAGKPHSTVHAEHQPAIPEAWRGRDKEKGMVAVLEVIDSAIAYEGFCPICDKKVMFSSDNERYRDHLICTSCLSLPRHRAFFHVLKQKFPKYRELKIHESSPLDYIERAMFHDCLNYSASHFWPNLPLGSLNGKYTCQNLEILTFPDASFDLFITMDVMEHLLNPFQAVREIKRVLRPGGAYIFTAPIFNRPNSILRAYRRGDSIINILPPDYHGNPIGNGSLVTWEYGEDFVDLIPSERINLVDRNIGVIGKMTDVFLIRI